MFVDPDVFESTCCLLFDTYRQKNAAYGNNMSMNFRKYGEVAYAMRISDKLGRLKNLRENPDIPAGDESVMDTLLDAVNYCILCVGDIAAKAAMGLDNTINVAFTEELLVDLRRHPELMYEKYEYMKVNKYDFMEVLDNAYVLDEMAQGCYSLAIMLLVEYHLELLKQQEGQE